MSRTEMFPLVAVDIGNSRIKFGLFDPPADNASLPIPSRHLALGAADGDFNAILDWLRPAAPSTFNWRIGSVNRLGAMRLMDWLKTHDVASEAQLLAAADLPLTVELERPEAAGVDRLLAAVSVNRLRTAGRPAIIVNLGTAITIDVVSAEGAFLGGAILPGSGMAARSLNEFTDLLPLVDVEPMAEPPPALGRSTIDAMRSGLFWGAVGSVREVVRQLNAETGLAADVFVGGGGIVASFAGVISDQGRYVPHLVLSGIALTAVK